MKTPIFQRLKLYCSARVRQVHAGESLSRKSRRTIRFLFTLGAILLVLPLSASGNSKSGQRLITRRYATVGIINEKQHSLVVVKDLKTDQTYYLRIGDLLGRSRLVINSIQDRRVGVRLEDTSFFLPAFQKKRSYFETRRSEIKADEFKTIVGNCRQDAEFLCRETKAEGVDETLKCLTEQLTKVSTGCESQLMILEK